MCHLKQAMNSSNRPKAHIVIIQQLEDRKLEYFFEEEHEQNQEHDEEE